MMKVVVLVKVAGSIITRYSQISTTQSQLLWVTVKNCVLVKFSIFIQVPLSK